MIGICPYCRSRYSYNKYDKDYVHNCVPTSSDDMDEDVLVVGNYVNEETGSIVTVPKTNLKGLENKVQGTNAGIEGKRVHDLTDEGNIESLYRQRKHNEFINL